MKHGRRPTRRQKEIIKRARLNVDNWLVVKNLQGELHLENRVTGKTRILKVGRAG
jgi:hypothetical protein